VTDAHLPMAPQLVIGGCRSGKSAYAEQLILRFPPPYVYLATALVQDREMEERVDAHRRRRGPEWQTTEAPLEPLPLLREIAESGRPVLFDCLTMWLTNLLLDDGPDSVAEKVADLCSLLAETEQPIILVSNEVGAGIVPENQLARTFRDLAGFANQEIAAACRAVTWMVAGIPVLIKPAPDRPHWPGQGA
jgi:adenosylcobinamide kinase/adenosylcobinamide-phosphate guanylyltransferase